MIDDTRSRLSAGQGPCQRSAWRRLGRRILLLVAVVVGAGIATVPLSTVAYAAPGWSAPLSVDSGFLPGSISCASATLCAVVDDNGRAFTYNGSSWSTPTSINSGHALFSVSCPLTTNDCVAVGNASGGGAGVAYTGTSWSSPMFIDPGSVLDVSCAATTFCLATAAGGNTLTYTGSSWIGPTESGFGPGSVSCATSGFCVAMDSEKADYYNGSSWTQSGIIDTTGNGLTAVSCPTTTFCAAVDGNGKALTYNGSSWTVPANIDPSGNGLYSVSCATPSFCVTTDDVGDVLTYNGTSWSAPVNIDSPGNGLASVSCPLTTFCAAVDYAGNVLTYVPPAPPTISSFSPTTGAVGTKVIIMGTNLAGATKVKFNGVAATVTKDTATEIKTKVPAGATTGKIKVTTPGGTVKSTTDFTVT